jgi:hypothetical protein
MMSRNLLFGVAVVFLATAVGVALLSSVTSRGFLTATQNDAVFCSSGLLAKTVSASASRTLPPCPPGVTRS